ncbi:MAG: hypothetical protein IJ070_03140 [Firmicutes bacterium]|nr:hypothetical protein [Bacillota bacterium]
MKLKRFIPVILMIAVCVVCVAVTKEVVTSQADVKESTYLGTYQIDDSKYVYLSVLRDDAENGYSYMIFDGNGVMSEGTCSEGYRALSMMDADGDICIGTLVYSFGDYIFSENGKAAVKAEKLADAPVVPDE